MKAALLPFFSFLILSNLSSLAQSALDFDGINDHVQTSYPGISGDAPRTVIAWINTTAIADPNDDGVQKIITDWGTQSTGGRFTFNVLWNNAIRVEVSGSGLSGTIPVNDGVWHQVAVTYDPDSTNDFSLYVDGVLDVSGNITTAVNTIPSVDMLIGMRVDEQRYFEGFIDEVSIWDKALTLDEIVENSCITGVPSQIENLAAYYNFNEGEGSLLTDLAGGYDGNLMNMDETDWVISDVCASGYNISFVVTEVDGTTPVEGASIDLDGELLSTDENGEAVYYYYEEGTYNYTVSKSGYYEQTGSVELIDEDVIVSIELPQILYYDLKFIVQEDPGGAPVDSAVVNLDGLIQYTNEDGEVIFTDYLPGTYSYSVAKEGYGLVPGEVEVIDADVEVEISLPITVVYYNIEFLVTEEAGSVYVEGALVNLDGTEQSTNENGETTFLDYLPGTYPYSISKEGYTVASGNVEVVDADVSVAVDLLISGLRQNNQQLLRIYPNPSSGRFSIQLNSTATLLITDLSGRLIRTVNWNPDSPLIDLTGVRKGIYLLKMVSPAGIHSASLVIK